jgi:hypothetical protein
MALLADNARLREEHDLINQLRKDECTSVEICNDNPDFSGAGSLIYVHCGAALYRFDGDTVLACLQKAAAALASKEDK